MKKISATILLASIIAIVIITQFNLNSAAQSTHIQQQPKIEIVVSYNPSNNSIHLEYTPLSADSISAKIFTLSGRCVETLFDEPQLVEMQKKDIKLKSLLSAGMYNLKIEQNGNTFSKKFMAK